MKQSTSHSKSQTIGGKIVNGYLVVVGIICILVIGSILSLLVVERGYKDIVSYKEQQFTAQSVITAHYKWLDELNNSILNGTEFTGSLDPNTCALGK